MDFMAEKVNFCGSGRPSTIKKSILVEGQIFDFWGGFYGEAPQDSNFFRAFLE